MSEHNKSSSSDESWHKVALNYEEFDILLTDIDEAELVGLGRDNEVEHLSAGTFSSPAFPASGRIHGINIRYMIPLVCQRAGKLQSKAINIWFLVDSSSPFTCISLKSLEALLGQGNATNPFYSLAIHDQKSNIECQVSKGHYQEVNLLGANAMRRLKLSIIVDWDDEKFKLFTTERRCIVGENLNSSSNLTALVIGNSYAENFMGIFVNECHDVYSNIYSSSLAACEPLMRTILSGYDCSQDDMFRMAIEEYKPDVLFIVVRHITSMQIINGTNPFDDNVFRQAVERLQYYETMVKRKIFILDVFPEVSNMNTFNLNLFLQEKGNLTDEKMADFSTSFQIGKQRMARLASLCSKCVLYDYATQFFIDGKFKVYDPKYYVSYFTKGKHMTPAGLERIRPLYRHLCHYF